MMKLKWILHPKMKILSSFTHPQVDKPVWVSFFCWTQRKIFWRTIGTIDFHSIFFFRTMEVNGAKQLFGSNRSSKYLPLCSSEEINSYRFATTWGWGATIFGCSIPLKTTKVAIGAMLSCYIVRDIPSKQ